MNVFGECLWCAADVAGVNARAAHESPQPSWLAWLALPLVWARLWKLGCLCTGGHQCCVAMGAATPPPPTDRHVDPHGPPRDLSSLAVYAGSYAPIPTAAALLSTRNATERHDLTWPVLEAIARSEPAGSTIESAASLASGSNHGAPVQ